MPKFHIFAVTGLLAIAGVGAAQAEVETIHDKSLRMSTGTCKGDHRTVASSRLPDMGRSVSLTGPGEFSLEFFANGIDLDPAAIRLTGGGGAVRILSRTSTGGVANLQKGCGAIGSVMVRLRVEPTLSMQVASLEIGSERYGIGLYPRRVIGLDWHRASIFGTGNCLRVDNSMLTTGPGWPSAGYVSLSGTDPSALRLTISPRNIENSCKDVTGPKLKLPFAWQRETSTGVALPESTSADPVKVTVRRIQSASNVTAAAALDPRSTTSSEVSGQDTLSLNIADLFGFIGTTTYEIQPSPATSGLKPLTLIVESSPKNGVSGLTLAIPTATSTVRKVTATYRLHVPAGAGTEVSWKTFAYDPATFSRLTNCFTQSEGTTTAATGSSTGTVELSLTDAPGCSGGKATITLRYEGETVRPMASFNDPQGYPLIQKSQDLTLPARMVTNNPLLPTTPKPIGPIKKIG